MIALAADDRRGLVRWLICGTVVLCVHAAIAAALMQWREPIAEGDLGNDVILLELRPEQVQAEPVPEKPVEKPEDKPSPLPEQPSEVPQEVLEPQPQQTPQAELPPAPTTTAAQTARAPRRCRPGGPRSPGFSSTTSTTRRRRARDVSRAWRNLPSASTGSGTFCRAAS
ncbi:MAG TPA: hypothetical protein VGI22_14790 [Xanthobacteraceae bacterium]